MGMGEKAPTRQTPKLWAERTVPKEGPVLPRPYSLTEGGQFPQDASDVLEVPARQSPLNGGCGESSLVGLCSGNAGFQHRGQRKATAKVPLEFGNRAWSSHSLRTGTLRGPSFPSPGRMTRTCHRTRSGQRSRWRGCGCQVQLHSLHPVPGRGPASWSGAEPGARPPVLESWLCLSEGYAQPGGTHFTFCSSVSPDVGVTSNLLLGLLQGLDDASPMNCPQQTLPSPATKPS